jgi:hypothetical protein
VPGTRLIGAVLLAAGLAAPCLGAGIQSRPAAAAPAVPVAVAPLSLAPAAAFPTGLDASLTLVPPAERPAQAPPATDAPTIPRADDSTASEAPTAPAPAAAAVLAAPSRDAASVFLAPSPVAAPDKAEPDAAQERPRELAGLGRAERAHGYSQQTALYDGGAASPEEHPGSTGPYEPGEAPLPAVPIEVSARRALSAGRLVKPIGEGGQGNVFAGLWRAPGMLSPIPAVAKVYANGKQAEAALAEFAIMRMIANTGLPGTRFVMAPLEFIDALGRVRRRISGLVADAAPDGNSVLIEGYANRGTLDDLIQVSRANAVRGWGLRMSPEHVLRWARQAARGLSAVHEAGYGHRDIKPKNLLLTDPWEIRIADFGMAGTLEEELHKFSGTPQFTPPAVLAAHLAGRPVAVLESHDVYALALSMELALLEGVLGYELSGLPSELVQSIKFPGPKRARLAVPVWEIYKTLGPGLSRLSAAQERLLRQLSDIFWKKDGYRDAESLLSRLRSLG